MILKGQIMIRKSLLAIFLVLFTGSLNAETKTYKMVFVPASEKGDESDYTSLILITEKLTGFNIDTKKRSVLIRSALNTRKYRQISSCKTNVRNLTLELQSG